MNQLFYSHLVPEEDVIDQLEQYQLSDEEKLELTDLILQMFDHRIMEVILIHLPPEHHDELTRRMSLAPDDITIMVFIKTHAPSIEEEIQQAGKNLKVELQAVLNQAMQQRRRSGDAS